MASETTIESTWKAEAAYSSFATRSSRMQSLLSTATRSPSASVMISLNGLVGSVESGAKKTPRKISWFVLSGKMVGKGNVI